MADLIVAGAGMAGLAAAAHARGRGAEVVVHEKRAGAGGSMLLSSGVFWRHRDFESFRAECRDGDERLQRLVWERLDGDLGWLESLGAAVTSRETGNPRTSGARFDTDSIVRALSAAAGEIRFEDALEDLPGTAPVVLATGGFPADRELLRRYVTDEAEHLIVRAAPGGTGDGLRLALSAGARQGPRMDEVYGRNMPAPPALVPPDRFVALAQLYARHADVCNEAGERFESRTWSEIDVLQWTARQPRARAWFALREERFDEPVGDRTAGAMVRAAEAAGAPVTRRDGVVEVETVAGITSTLGGVAVEPDAAAAPGVWVAGDDAGGIAAGGYASGLAAALVLGRRAAEAALGG